MVKAGRNPAGSTGATVRRSSTLCESAPMATATGSARFKALGGATGWQSYVLRSFGRASVPWAAGAHRRRRPGSPPRPSSGAAPRYSRPLSDFAARDFERAGRNGDGCHHGLQLTVRRGERTRVRAGGVWEVDAVNRVRFGTRWLSWIHPSPRSPRREGGTPRRRVLPTRGQTAGTRCGCTRPPDRTSSPARSNSQSSGPPTSRRGPSCRRSVPMSPWSRSRAGVGSRPPSTRRSRVRRCSECR